MTSKGKETTAQKTETAAQFIARKNTQFSENKRQIPMKDIGRRGKFYFQREAWTFLPQHNLPEKVFVFERLRKVGSTGELSHSAAWRDGDIEYRIGYFIVGKIGRAKGRWVWGQYCPLIPTTDFDKLIAKAKKEKVIIG